MDRNNPEGLHIHLFKACSPGPSRGWAHVLSPGPSERGAGQVGGRRHSTRAIRVERAETGNGVSGWSLEISRARQRGGASRSLGGGQDLGRGGPCLHSPQTQRACPLREPPFVLTHPPLSLSTLVTLVFSQMCCCVSPLRRPLVNPHLHHLPPWTALTKRHSPVT